MIAESERMVVPRAEKAYEEYAWVIFFALAMLGAAAPSFFSLISGTLPDAIYLPIFLILTIYISLTGFRTGKKWAWFAFWYVPVLFLITSYTQYRTGYPWQAFILFAAISVIGLLLPLRKFFPKVTTTARA